MHELSNGKCNFNFCLLVILTSECRWRQIFSMKSVISFLSFFLSLSFLNLITLIEQYPAGVRLAIDYNWPQNKHLTLAQTNKQINTHSQAFLRYRIRWVMPIHSCRWDTSLKVLDVLNTLLHYQMNRWKNFRLIPLV